MACDMCGKVEAPFRIRVEGTVMTVCAGCKSYGEIVVDAKPRAQLHRREAVQSEKFLMVGEGFALKIKHARENRNLTQEELAKRLHLKESQLHAFENGHHRPDIETARKLEKELHIRIVEEYTEEHSAIKAKSSGPMTIGDLIKK